MYIMISDNFLLRLILLSLCNVIYVAMQRNDITIRGRSDGVMQKCLLIQFAVIEPIKNDAVKYAPPLPIFFPKFL